MHHEFKAATYIPAFHRRNTSALHAAFIHTTELVNGLVIGKMCWFHLVMLFFSVCVFFVALTKMATAIAFSSSDLLLLTFTGIVLITYKWSLNPEPEKLIFTGQLVILWFLLRYILTAYREFNFSFCSSECSPDWSKPFGECSNCMAMPIPTIRFPADGLFL